MVETCKIAILREHKTNNQLADLAVCGIAQHGMAST